MSRNPEAQHPWVGGCGYGWDMARFLGASFHFYGNSIAPPVTFVSCREAFLPPPLSTHCRLQPYGHVRSIFSGFPLRNVNKSEIYICTDIVTLVGSIVEILFSQASFIFIFFVDLGCDWIDRRNRCNICSFLFFGLIITLSQCKQMQCGLF